MTIGFGNGDFYRIQNDPLERYSEKYLDIYATENANAIELNCLDEKHADYLLNNDLNLSKFDYVSIHGPSCITFSDNDQSNRILLKFQNITKKYKIKNILFHADTIKDWSVFTKYSNLPISIENMDDRKKFGQTVDEVLPNLEKYDLNLTLDLQHCFVNDPTMKLAQEFHKKCYDRIVQYHISGFDEELLHYPLFKTKQDIIIESLEKKEIPIIIESTFDQVGEHEKELTYIKNKLNIS